MALAHLQTPCQSRRTVSRLTASYPVDNGIEHNFAYFNWIGNGVSVRYRSPTSPAVTPEQLPFGTGDPDFRVDIVREPWETVTAASTPPSVVATVRTVSNESIPLTR